MGGLAGEVAAQGEEEGGAKRAVAAWAEVAAKVAARPCPEPARAEVAKVLRVRATVAAARAATSRAAAAREGARAAVRN